jgi:hypothetical protein
MPFMSLTPARIDEASARVVQATLGRPRTAMQIAAATGVPVALVFRRIRQLKALGVLREDVRVVDVRGREVTLYVSTLRSGTVFVEGERPRVVLSMSAEAQETSLESML